MSGEDKTKWLKAVEEERNSVEENKTWDYVDVSEAKGRKVLSSRWVFKIKDDGRHRARLAVRGFEQIENRNYFDTYAPDVSISSLRVLLSIAAAKDFSSQVFDVSSAFLHGELDEEICMHIPEGFKEQVVKFVNLRRVFMA